MLEVEGLPNRDSPIIYMQLARFPDLAVERGTGNILCVSEKDLADTEIQDELLELEWQALTTLHHKLDFSSGEHNFIVLRKAGAHH